MIPLSGIPESSPPVDIHLLANSYVSLDTCVFASEISTPHLAISILYLLATLSFLTTISSPKSIYWLKPRANPHK